jgi:Tfp pilus assembly protein PilW
MFIHTISDRAGAPGMAAARRLRSQGWLLTETMVGLSIGLTFLTALVVIFVTCSMSFAGIGNYVNLDRRSRNALDHMTGNIRNAKVLTSFSPTALVFKYDDAGTTNLAYRYDAFLQELTEEWTVAGSTTSTTLLTDCNAFAFSLYDRFQVATTDLSPGHGKVIGLSWQCFGTVLSRTNTEQMQQARIVIRNQP